MMKRAIPLVTAKSLRWIFVITLIEFLFFIISGVSFSSLGSDPFFSLPADPFFLFVYGIRLPQVILSMKLLAVVLDTLVVVLLAAFIIRQEQRIAFALFTLLFLYYLVLTGYLTHRNYQTGFFLVFVPFLFRKPASRVLAFEATRYFLLFFYFSAALLKLAARSFFDTGSFSHLLAGQFTPYFLEGNTSFRTDLNLYLVTHPFFAYGLYLLGFAVEFITIAGFFTRKFDKLIGVALIIFHFSNWLIMDIGPWGQISFICLLFARFSTSTSPQEVPIPQKKSKKFSFF